MPTLPEFVFADHSETLIREAADDHAKVRNHVLLGTYLGIVGAEGDFYKVVTRKAGPGGYVRMADTTVSAPLKIFFVDVGQGDGTLIECPQGVVVVDGGVGEGFHHFLRYRYGPLIDDGETIAIKAMFISHPDGDHYKGLQHLLEDADFRVDTIYHNGLMRYPRSTEGSRTKMINQGYLEQAQLNGKDAYFVTDIVDSLDDLIGRIADMPAWFSGFWEAADQARQAGRLGNVQRLQLGDKPAGFESKAGGKLRVKVLGPVASAIDPGARKAFLAFDDPTPRDQGRPDYPEYGYSHSHTRNGHSLVLKLEFGKHRVLLGGDLNIPAQQHLLDHYGTSNPFRVDVAKACHHGSSDFSPEFLKKVKPHATTISSGDNKSFDHPTADAVGAVAQHSRGMLPLVFSTELARAYSVDPSGGVAIHYGLTNLRSNGEVLTMAQMKEQRTHAGRPKADIWDSFVVPWPGKFWYERS